jgi:DNA mismatch repair protein MutS
MGDFFEMFYEDAEVASRVLGLTLTSRNNGGAAEVPLAGVPVKAAAEYLRRLVNEGFRVAVCDQVEDPKSARGIVRREVVETVTPGAAFSDDILDGARNNFLCAVRSTADAVAIAAADVSTGEFRLMLTLQNDAPAILARLAPRELLLPRDSVNAATKALLSSCDGVLLTERDRWEFESSVGAEELRRHFGLLTLEGLGIQSTDDLLVGAGAALLRYLKELQPSGVPHLAMPSIERPGAVVPLDEMTLRNLEMIEPLRSGASGGTLVDVLDRTRTPMGARTLRNWIVAPLLRKSEIDARLDATGALASDATARNLITETLRGVRDVERLASKAAAARATPRELGALGASLDRLPSIAEALARVAHAGRITQLAAEWDSCEDLAAMIRSTLVESPPAGIGDEPSIARGVDSELDSLRELRDGGKDAIVRIQAEERAATGIQSLKVGFNRVFGYYIEISNANKHLVPSSYQRRQTLTGAERYVTPELKEYEERVLSAAERIEQREREIFEKLRSDVGVQVARLQRVARAVAEVDVLATLAEVACLEGYVRPIISDGFDLEISGGRHPVVERMMPRERFIPNDVRFTEDARLVILTGPNMSGKSTVLRQTGLIVLMAQMGSFVPASAARVGIVDRVFTRVGASDNLVRGQSTFMVEMTETSAILRNASSRSLVLLDEIGRGTSTYDGVSIAWAVSEHLHNNIRCKTIFATHYHELTQLAEELPAVRNYNVEVREAGEEVLFLYRLLPGGADRSYGIEVGRLAGLPMTVIRRARAVLELLEGEEIARGLSNGGSNGERRDRDATPGGGQIQLGLFGAGVDPVLKRLEETDTNELTPLNALTLLAELNDELRNRKK